MALGFQKWSTDFPEMCPLHKPINLKLSILPTFSTNVQSTNHNLIKFESNMYFRSNLCTRNYVEKC